MDDAQLQTVWQHRQLGAGPDHVSRPLALFMKHTLAKRVRQVSKLARIWDEVLPAEILNHTALEGFRRGVLTVIVDTASHRYHLRTLLDGGLQREIQARFRGALNRIRLVPGQIGVLDAVGRPRFEL